MLEIRPATFGEMPAFARIVGAALALPPSDFRDLAPEWTLCAFEDRRLATAYAAWPLQMRFNGAALPIAAVTTVATAPVSRRRGYLRRITEQHFRRLFDLQQQPVAALYASQSAIYQRYGYGIISTHHHYEVEPRFIQFALPLATPGRLRELERETDFPLLVDLYRRFRAERTGAVHRGLPMWAAGVLREPTGLDALSIVVYEEDGQPQGYCVYVTGPGGKDGPGPSQRLEIRDLVWLTASAYRALWQHLAGFELVRRIIWPLAPPDDPLPHLVLEPKMLRDSCRDGVLARIVDVARAAAVRRYPVSARLRFRLADDLCPWNTGAWELTTASDGGATARLADGADADLSLPASTLAMLLFGQISASEAARMGRLQVHDACSLVRWDAALRTQYRPFCADHW